VFLLVEFSRWAIPVLFIIILSLGWATRVRLYEAFVKGAEQGFSTAVKVLPVLVAMMVAVAVFRASGAMELLAACIKPLLAPIGFPAEVLPLAFLRPLSGGAALGLTAELISAYGPDSFIGRLASVMQGSSDTTLYVVTLYFGSVGITRYRYAVAVGLTADIVGLLAAVVVCRYVF
jgi:spore maturation protein B